MQGYYPHFILITSSQDNNQVRGLIIFNQDSTEPTRVNLYHLSSIDSSKFEEILDLGLEYVWKTMHCATIRIYLHHYKQDVDGEEKMRVNDDVKTLLKQRRFKWKTLRNETSTGQRIEVLEG